MDHCHKRLSSFIQRSALASGPPPEPRVLLSGFRGFSRVHKSRGTHCLVLAKARQAPTVLSRRAAKRLHLNPGCRAWHGALHLPEACTSGTRASRHCKVPTKVLNEIPLKRNITQRVLDGCQSTMPCQSTQGHDPRYSRLHTVAFQVVRAGLGFMACPIVPWWRNEKWRCGVCLGTYLQL